MTNILWFSRHAMTVAQKEDLIRIFGEVVITQVSGSPANVHVPFEGVLPEVGETQPENVLVGELRPLKEIMAAFAEVAVVLPVNLIQQALPHAKSGRLLTAVSKRVLQEDGKAEFVFQGWDAITEVEIVSERL